MALLTLLALSEGAGKDMGPFKVEGGLTLWTWVVFITLLFLLKKFAWPAIVQSAEEREAFDDTTKCILCAACTTACPSFWADGAYYGPAAIVQGHRFLFDSRDRAAGDRLRILGEQMGVWRCRTAFSCTLACPRGIQVTRAIGEVKQAVARGSVE